MAAWWAAHGRETGVLTLENAYADHYRLHPGVKRITINWQLPRTRLHIPIQFARHQAMLRTAVLDYMPDVLISFIDRTNIHMLFALAGTGIPHIVTERTDPRRHRIGLSWSLARRLSYPFASALAVQTQAVASWAGRVVPKGKIRVIPNFVRQLPGPEAGPEHDGSPPFILSVGRLGREKGHDVLIRAFARAGARQKGWRLVILGEGSERSALHDLAAQLGVSDAVDMPGVVEEPARWMYRAQVFVLPSRYEGFPNALLEAMACGCAAVSADCPSGPAEIIRHGDNGLLVPSEDIDALARAMGRLMDEEELRTRLGARARSVVARFSQETIMASWDDVIESVCASRR